MNNLLKTYITEITTEIINDSFRNQDIDEKARGEILESTFRWFNIDSGNLKDRLITRMINDLESLKEQTRRRIISDEGFPKEEGLYLCKTAAGNIYTCHYYGYESFDTCEEGDYLTADDEDEFYRVVEWQPLPPEPEE